MGPKAKRRTLIGACGLLATVFAFRNFYFQELFFAFLLFAITYVIFLAVVGLAAGLWFLYARGVVYLASRAAEQGHHALPVLRVLVLWLAPSVTKTAGAVSAGQQVLFYPFGGILQRWLKSFRLDAAHFREHAERAARHLRLHLKQS